MATVHSLSSPPSAGGSSPSAPTYHVATRQLSADFSAVGPDQPALDLGPIDSAQFRRLLDQLAAFEPIKLVDADPQLIVTVKNNRFLIEPQGGKLIVRPYSARDQMFFKLTPAEIPAFFEDAKPPPAKASTTLIGTAVARAESVPVAPAPRPAPAPPPARKTGRTLILAGLVAFALIAAGSAWIFFAPAPPVPPPPPAPVGPPPEFDLIKSPLQLANLQKKFTGTYVTSGEAGERMLELRADNTFHYQEFGSGLSVTTHDTGSFTFAWRHGTETPVLRAGGLGVIEIRDENSLVIREVIFTRLPTATK
jgi:hypothetical protein